MASLEDITEWWDEFNGAGASLAVEVANGDLPSLHSPEAEQFVREEFSRFVTFSPEKP